MIGEGIQWLKHFCHFHVEKMITMSLTLEKRSEKWMVKHSIPHEQAAGMMTAENSRIWLLYKEIRKYSNDGNRDGRGTGSVEITNRSNLEYNPQHGTLTLCYSRFAFYRCCAFRRIYVCY